MVDCIFCKIAAGEIPSPRVYETDKVFVIKDINPKTPVHDLIVPKKHIVSLNDLDDESIAADLLLVAKKVAEIEGLTEKGYRLIINTGRQGGQLVDHLHLHLLGGKNLGPKIICE
jgi:histidine triad (HIT) family protein